jgi:hypothetical protein
MDRGSMSPPLDPLVQHLHGVGVETPSSPSFDPDKL